MKTTCVRLLILQVLATLWCATSAALAAKPADISFDELKIDIKPASRFDESMLTDDIKELDGQVIKIRGYMWPSFQRKGITAFVFLLNRECQFGSAKDPVWCNIRVTMEEGESAEYSTQPMTIEGKLDIDLMKGKKYDVSIYKMENVRVVK